MADLTISMIHSTSFSALLEEALDLDSGVVEVEPIIMETQEGYFINKASRLRPTTTQSFQTVKSSRTSFFSILIGVSLV